MQPVLIRGGRVIDAARMYDATADVLLADGVVARISEEPLEEASVPADWLRLDAEGCVVAPGLIDVHVHFREPSGGRHEETIATGSASALNGGFTTVCCMPNTTPPLDSAAMIGEVLERAAATDGVRVFAVGCATQGRAGEEAAPIGEMAAAGAIAFSDDGDAVADGSVMAAVLRAARAAGRCFMQHCQEPSMTRGASMNAGALAERMGQIGWPAEAEEVIIERDVGLTREIGARYHAQHVSSAGSVDIIARARSEGLPVTGEASPHHLLLTEQACEDLGTAAKMNPPLRRREDIERLKAGIEEGVITILATDHAPHPRSSKDVPFAEAAFGIVGLDCALALYAKALIEEGPLDWPRMLALMTVNPARLLGLDRVGLGGLMEGGAADVTVIDPQMRWTIRAEEFATTGRNCPFDGREVTGRAVATIVAGSVRQLRDAARASGAGASEAGGGG